MPNANDLFALPAGPAELCFDKNEFMKKTFSVDDFLHEHRNAAALETIRDDLGIYLKVLRSAMIELINEDYADFVNLSTNLVGLDQSINGIQTPLEQLRDDVLNIKLVLNENMNEINDCINQKKLLRNYKKNLKSLAKVQNSIGKLSGLLESQLNCSDIKPVMLERAALELIQLQFHAKFCNDYLDTAQTEKARSLHTELLSKIRAYFLNALNSDADSLERCLRIYATLDECEVAETVFRDDIVGTYMDKKISENTLQNSAQGLVGIYNQILDFISLNMKDLLLLTHHTDKVKGFDFLVNSFWREVERRLESHLASIFAPGNPDSFYLKYKSTVDFLANIETMLGSEQAVKAFHQHPQYKSFQSRWNLPVYFQIRFQEIAGQLEITCDQSLTEQTISKNITSDLECVPLQIALTCITKSWSDGIYIPQLFPKFWKLTVQIISRITRWIAQSIKDIDKQNAIENKPNKILFLISLYKDGKVFIKNFPSILAVATSKMPIEIQSHSSLLTRCMQEAESDLFGQLNSIENVLIKEISSKSAINIRQVSDIPRLYRKTNRDVPSKHCAYVENMIEPFNSFRKQFTDDIGVEKMQELFLKSFSRITVQYFKAIEEVLTSVQKTEESLRRLKNLREKTTTTASSQSITDRQGMSDDDKIRLQLQVDVKHWTSEIESNGIKRFDVEKLGETLNLVEDTTKINKASDKH